MLRKICYVLMAVATLGFSGVRAEEVRIGGPLVDVEVYNADYEYMNLSDFVGKDGKYLLVNFWTWNCPRCHAGFVEVEKYVKAYGDKLNVVSVMLSDRTDDWVETYRDTKLFSWPNLTDGKSLKEGAAVTYDFLLFPFYVIVDQQGTIQDMWSGFRQDTFQQHMEPYFPKL